MYHITTFTYTLHCRTILISIFTPIHFWGAVCQPIGHLSVAFGWQTAPQKCKKGVQKNVSSKVIK